MTQIFVDADACPVKEEAVRVAERHGVDIHFVSNAWMRLEESDLVHRVIVDQAPDAADDWIAMRASDGDVVITADIPLASRCLANGAEVLGPTGRSFTKENIGMSLAMRDLNAHMRETGESKGYNASFTRKDRSRFLESLEQTVRRAARMK